MRAASRVATVALAALLLSGCVPQQPTATPTPEASAAPIFATDEEALAAATAAYAAYSAISDQIGSEGGANPERLKPFSTQAWFEKDRAQFAEFAKTGRSLSGTTKFDSLELQSFDDQSISIYLCADVSGIRVLDSQGTDLTPSGREERVSLEVGFDLTENPGTLLLASSQVWDGASICDG